MKDYDKKESGKGAKKQSEREKRESIDKAFVFFSNACVEDPQFAMAYFRRGKCYMMMHDYKRALYDFSAAILNETRSFNKQPYRVNGGLINAEGGLALFYMHGGMCNYYLGQYEEALAHYEVAAGKAKGVYPPLLDLICYNRGLANASLIQYEGAILDQE